MCVYSSAYEMMHAFSAYNFDSFIFNLTICINSNETIFLCKFKTFSTDFFLKIFIVKESALATPA